MNKKLFSLKTLAAAALLCSAAVAQAGITVFSDRALFLAAVSSPGTDNFNDLSATSYPTPLARMAGIYNYLASSGPDSYFYPAGSGGDMWLSTNVATDTITFSNFAPTVYALGGYFFGSDVNGAFLPGATVTLMASGGDTQTVVLNNATTTTFLGFTSTSPLVSVLLGAQQGANPVWPTANDLVLAVPEPASYAMMLAGVILLGGLARRRAG